jgi:hypothetical protein
MTSETQNSRPLETDAERARRQSEMFDDQSRSWGTTHIFVWLVVLAAVTAIMIGASLLSSI